MDLPWGDERTKQFITNVGLITSDGPFGQNIMACEWTHHISYSPGLIAVCINFKDATNANIKKTKEFGVNIAAADQNVVSSVAGGSTGKEVDKISALKELGFEFYEGKKIKALMVKDAVLNVECRVIKTIKLGDRTMFVGEVMDASVNKGKEPLAYHAGRYWKLENSISEPDSEQLRKISEAVSRHKKA